MWPTHKKDDEEKGIKKGERKMFEELNLFEKYDYFGVCTEIEVGKTLQGDIDKINIEKLKKE